MAASDRPLTSRHGLKAWPDRLAGAADAPDDGLGLDIRRPSAEQRRRLLAGETLAYPVTEPADSDLAAGVALYLPAPLARVADALTSPEMVLKEEDIAAFVANWQPKSQNIRAISASLGLGLESLTFLDDNPYERAEVRRAIRLIC